MAEEDSDYDLMDELGSSSLWPDFPLSASAPAEEHLIFPPFSALQVEHGALETRELRKSWLDAEAARHAADHAAFAAEAVGLSATLTACRTASKHARISYARAATRVAVLRAAAADSFAPTATPGLTLRVMESAPQVAPCTTADGAGPGGELAPQLAAIQLETEVRRARLAAEVELQKTRTGLRAAVQELRHAHKHAQLASSAKLAEAQLAAGRAAVAARLRSDQHELQLRLDAGRSMLTARLEAEHDALQQQLSAELRALHAHLAAEQSKRAIVAAHRLYGISRDAENVREPKL